MRNQERKFEKKLRKMWQVANLLEENQKKEAAEKLRTEYWKKYRANKKPYALH